MSDGIVVRIRTFPVLPSRSLGRADLAGSDHDFRGTTSMAVEPLIFELSKPGRRGVRFPDAGRSGNSLPDELMRDDLDWPEVSEIDVIRHFTRLCQKNHAIDIGIYPLGSCTMKYNPKINEAVARLPGFAHDPPLPGPSDGPGRAGADVGAAGDAGRDLRLRRRRPAAGGRRPRRVDRRA